MNLMMLAATSAALAANPSPEMRGAVDSPVAFYEACEALRHPPADASRGVSARDKVLLGVGAELCKGMIDAVSSTVAQADGGYEFHGNKVCLGPNLTGDQVLDELGVMVKEHREALIADQQTKTPAAILIALQRLSTCK